MAYIVLLKDVSQKVFEIMMLAIENNISMEEVVGETAEIVLSVMQTINCTNGICNGTTKQGVTCKKKVGISEMYCTLHDSQRLQCAKPKRVDDNLRALCFGITKKGHLCKRLACTEEGYCHTHQYTQQNYPIKESSVRQVQIQCCTQSTKKGDRCKGRVKQGKTTCFFHSKAIVKTCLGVTKKGMCYNIIHGNNAKGNYCMFHLNEYYKKIEMEREFAQRREKSKVNQSMSVPKPLSVQATSTNIPILREYKSGAEIIEQMFAKSIHQKSEKKPEKYDYNGLFPIIIDSEIRVAQDEILEDKSISEPVVHEILEKSISEPVVHEILEKSISEPSVHEILEKSISEPVVHEILEKSISEPSVHEQSHSLGMIQHRSEQELKNNLHQTKDSAWHSQRTSFWAGSLSSLDNLHKAVSLVGSNASISPLTRLRKESKNSCKQDFQRILPGNLSLDELLNATFVNKDDKKNKLFDKEALENLQAQEILIGAFTGSYKRVKLEEFEENLDDEDICSMFEIYVKGVKQKEDESLDTYREKLRKFKDYKPLM